MLSVYTRQSDCSYRDDTSWKRCRCPKWLDGTLPDETGRCRKTAKTRSWEKAEERRRTLEFEAEERRRALVEGYSAQRAIRDEPTTVADAIERFLNSKRKENLREATMAKLETIFKKQMLKWTKSVGIVHLAEITTRDLEAFRDTWKDGPLARKTKQERLIGFFHYCIRVGLIRDNPAAQLGRIKATESPTDYFPKHEFDRIIDATYIYQPKGWAECRHQATRLRVLTLLMRWSGLSIRDALTLERSRLNKDNELLLYRAKTGNPVYVPLPAAVAEALRNIPDGPKPNPRYFFWSGNGSPKSVVGNWQRSYRRLFDIADIRRDDGTRKRCHPHMFRDTFAVEMLLAGVPLDQVSMLLGHKSVRITEKHYAPWVKARQQQLASSVRKAWTIIENDSAKRSKFRHEPKRRALSTS